MYQRYVNGRPLHESQGLCDITGGVGFEDSGYRRMRDAWPRVIAALDGRHQVIPTDVLPGCEMLDIADTNMVFDAINRFRPDTGDPLRGHDQCRRLRARP